MIKHLLTLLGIVLLSGCQTTSELPGEKDPKNPWWSLEFIAPLYMVGWVEDSGVEDIHGRLFKHGSGGGIGFGEYGYETERARGWPPGLGGLINGVVGADMPKRIYVRWQSVVEPQTYRAWVDIPEEARQIMRLSTASRCPERPEQPANYRATLYLGLAPGGIIQVWVRDNCFKAIKVARAQAEVEPLGPHLGKSGGHYYPQPESSKRYIEQYGIPYGSW